MMAKYLVRIVCFSCPCFFDSGVVELLSYALIGEVRVLLLLHAQVVIRIGQGVHDKFFCDYPGA